MKRHWKTVQPRDLRNAHELCLEYARDKHNRSVDNVADLMGLTNKWTLYKWMEAGNLPVRMVKPFEHACGIAFVSKWLAMSDNKLVIDIPRGARVSSTDIQTLQAITHDAIGALIKFYNEQCDAESTMAAVQTSLEKMAWHRSNVEKFRQPELPFNDD